MGRRAHLLLLGGGGGVVRCHSVIKEKSPDFRSPEICISVIGQSRMFNKRLWVLDTFQKRMNLGDIA